LVEVCVALTLAAILATVAWMLVTALADSADRIARLGDSVEREATTAQLVRDLVRRAEIDVSHSILLHGTPDSVTFVSWCDAAWGWQERCDVSISALRGAGTSTLHLRTSSGIDALLPGPPMTHDLLYLDQNFELREWRSYWNSPLLLPAAVAVPRSRDTLLLVIAR
jgi:hypothetical protein